MSPIGAGTVLALFVLFCRVGGCLMLMPGFSSPRVPVQVRLFVVIAVSLALAPMLLAGISAALPDQAPATIARFVASETLTGGLIGLLGRLFLVALETLATAVATAIGLGNALGAPIEESEPLPSLVTLITLTATVLVFVTDAHWEVLRGLTDSYRALPVADSFPARFALSQLSDTASKTFLLTFRISSPFIVFTIIINLAIGLLNKLTPQIPVYFISLPFVIAAGFFLVYFTVKQFIQLFMAGFTSWLNAG